ncbi:putative transcriptional regulator (Cti6) [Aspergillus saccharolyticus JOP 1030-1]|uniref:Zinc finger PHD-type domain-containing protein n=1 Tax=Aspergillus saccharolyticus JOP 1030-1 TaxID=1450539 RepID=A0A318ZXB1_9EURO|nr:hypothetical protein BP01DRAFT_379128 [Aspergillus saccharolyticus JOP 1030-1]PYH48720.1 hypothetical protein BP01DRAFT_379128 [Aspergillus saccharolyticus JOP 1030-1]
MTPRRSSRARASQQPSPAILQHTNSSSSSNSMTRERNTRSHHKISSPQRSSTNRSQSFDDGDTGSKGDYRETRQRQRARGEEDNDQLKLADGDEEDGEDDEDEEEEITRCLCGQQEYPGLPPSRREAIGRNGLRGSIKDEAILGFSIDAADLLSDDIGSMFIQCDSCKVWQHGGCVGIMDEAMSPDEYFCEECRKDLHKILSEINGSYSSQYLPVAPPPPPTTVSSRESSRDNSRRNKDTKSRSNDTAANPKRRSTMNSRDAAYDEEEQLRRAIEESKEETKPGDELAARRPKRSRSDSEAQTTKRQRTSSPSPGAASKSNPVSQQVSEDESRTKSTNLVARRQRAASRGQRDIGIKETEEPESEAADATNRRKGRPDKANNDEAESENEPGSPTKPVATDPEPKPPSPEVTPAPAPEPAPSRPATRKSGRPPARRGGRVGRNQYTRDRDMNGTDSNFSTRSPRRGQSHDIGSDSPRINGIHLHSGESGKPSRPRYVNQRTTMNEMKRRVTAILEFISRMQVEMAVAGESTTPPNGTARINGSLLESALALAVGDIDPASATASDSDAGSGPASLEKDFKELSSVEMMDVLTRHLLKWQQEYGRVGER